MGGGYLELSGLPSACFVALARPKAPIHDKADKRDILLDAAVRLFAQKGYENAKISEIAKMARVSDGIVYEYFKNKEDLLLSIADRQMKADVAFMKEIFNIKHPLRKLRRFIKYYCGIYSRDQNYLKTFLLLIQTNRRFYELTTYDSFKEQNKLIITWV